VARRDEEQLRAASRKGPAPRPVYEFVFGPDAYRVEAFDRDQLLLADRGRLESSKYQVPSEGGMQRRTFRRAIVSIFVAFATR